MERVILVDSSDRALGTEEKIAAHEKGLLHRAISVFVFDSTNKRILLQQRALSKYHCPGLWSNTVCSHPRPGEHTIDAAHRRLQEEMGFDCLLAERFAFQYRVPFENGLTEHEFDHVFVGTYDGIVTPNPDEAAAYAWRTCEEFLQNIKDEPEAYTPWLRIIVGEYWNNFVR